MQNCPSPREFPEPRLRVAITISCRAAPEVGICTLGRCSQAMLLSERAEIKAHEVRGQFLSVWRGTFFSTAFQWDMGSQSAKAWGFLSSSCRNFFMQLTEKHRAYLPWDREARTHVWRLKNSYYFQMAPQARCKHWEKIESQRFTPPFTGLYSVISKFSIRCDDTAPPGCQMMFAGLTDKEKQTKPN